VYVRSLPRFGSLHQVVEDPATGKLQVGDDISELFRSRKHSFRQYASNVLNASIGGNLSALIGEPDASYSVDDEGVASNATSGSETSWSPTPLITGEFVVVAFEKAVFVQAVSIFETKFPGSVTEIAALNPQSGQYAVLWTGVVLPFTVSSRRVFTPDICVSSFLTTVIRIKFATTSVGGAAAFDAIALDGSTTLGEAPLPTIKDQLQRVAYVPSLARTLDVQETFNFAIRQCNAWADVTVSGATVARSLTLRSIQLNVYIEPMLETLSAGLQSGLLVFCVTGVLMCIAYLVGVCINMHHPVIKASSFPFCVIAALSCMLFCFDAMLITLQQIQTQSIDTCMAQQFLFGAAFSWLFGSLFLKSYRLNKIFNARDLRVVALSNRQLVLGVTLIHLADIAVKIAWAASDPPQLRAITRDTTVYYQCSTNPSFAWTVFAMEFVLGLALFIQSIRIRNVPMLFNEHRAIAFVTYNALVLLGVTGLLAQLFTSSGVAATTVISNVGLLGVGIVTTTVLLGHKLWQIYFDKQHTSALQRPSHLSASVFAQPPGSKRSDMDMSEHGVNGHSKQYNSHVSTSIVPLPPASPVSGKTRFSNSLSVSSNGATSRPIRNITLPPLRLHGRDAPRTMVSSTTNRSEELGAALGIAIEPTATSTAAIVDGTADLVYSSTEAPSISSVISIAPLDMRADTVKVAQE